MGEWGDLTPRPPSLPGKGEAEAAPVQGSRSAASARERLDRLRQLGVHRGLEGIRYPTPPEAPPAVERRGRRIEEVFQGVETATPHGVCLVADTRYVEHAGFLVGQPPLHVDRLPRLARDEGLAGFDLRRAAFVDVETTGLSGGTGTLAFLVGVGTFEGDAFRVRQFFMRDPAEEPALLHALGEMLGQYAGVVSFNGKAFDLPLLTTRFRLQRWRIPLQAAPHLDLLFAARRLWRARLGSCALGSLERHILGVERVDDVPGMLIPYLYFEYVRTGRVDRLGRVFYHNALDIVSMAALLARMCGVFAEPMAHGVCHGADWLSLGMCYEGAGETELAAEAYQTAMRCQLPPELHEQAKERYTQLCKRQGAWDAAVDEWIAQIRTGTAQRLYPYLELAKFYEHRARDYGAAMETVRAAMALVERSGARMGSLNRQAVLGELRHRLARLEKKAGRVEGTEC